MTEWKDGGWVSLEMIMKELDAIKNLLIDQGVDIFSIKAQLGGVEFKEAPFGGLPLPKNRIPKSE